jgi:ATP-dependent exoDNAse (exonuclease V) beta subunit
VRRVAAAASGCPTFKSRDSVLERPGGDPATKLTVCPGEHTFARGAEPYSVVWWSPEPDVLPLGAQASFGLRRDDLIVKDIPVTVLRGHLDAYHQWRASRDAAVAAAAVPSLEVMTVREAADRLQLPAVGSVAVTVEHVPGAATRPGGTRFGTLVHAVLADVPLANPTFDLVTKLATAHARVLGAMPEELASAIETVGRVLEHPILKRATRAAAEGRCHRETPITYRTGANALVEGVIDLAFEEDGGFTVVDFKTDRLLDGLEQRYHRQVQIYAAAIAAATGKPASGVLIRVV